MITNTFLLTGKCFLAIWSAHGRWRPLPTRVVIDSSGFLWIFQLEVSLESYRFPMRKLRKIMIFDAFQTLRYLISGHFPIVFIVFLCTSGIDREIVQTDLAETVRAGSSDSRKSIENDFGTAPEPTCQSPDPSKFLKNHDFRCFSTA